MAEQRYFSTTAPDGKTMETRILGEGYLRQAVGVLIAAGPTAPDAIFELWAGQPNQCTQLMNPVYQDVGIGYENGSWSLVLALPTTVSAPLSPKDDPGQVLPQSNPDRPNPARLNQDRR
jgi:uncharacterized protein YkwD